MTVFVDTSAFIAILNADDRFHPSASQTWERLVRSEERLACNNYILVETLALLQSRFGLDAVQVFQDNIGPVIDVHWIDPETHQRATSALLAAVWRDLSLVDCASFETIRRLGIRQIFTFDPHFLEYGFQVIPENRD